MVQVLHISPNGDTLNKKLEAAADNRLTRWLASGLDDSTLLMRFFSQPVPLSIAGARRNRSCQTLSEAPTEERRAVLEEWCEHREQPRVYL